jgi:protein-tyrosine phosphatase
MTGPDDTVQPLVDLHTHVLSGVDDGAASRDESREMLRIAAADGTRLIVATPHTGRVERDRILQHVAALNDLARADGIDITVRPGSEARLTPELVRAFADGQVVTLNQTAYLLVELPLGGPWPPNVTRAVFDLQLAGAWPVLAHAERYQALQRDPELLVELVRAGVVVQVNADSLLGRQGARARRAAEELVRSRLAHVVASDAHDARLRPPTLSGALQRVAELAGEAEARQMRQRAAAIVAGQALSLPDPIEPIGAWETQNPGLIRRWLARSRAGR